MIYEPTAAEHLDAAEKAFDKALKVQNEREAYFALIAIYRMLRCLQAENANR